MTKLMFQDFQAPMISARCWTCKYGGGYGLELMTGAQTHDLMDFIEACKAHIALNPGHSVELLLDGRFNVIEE